VTTSSLLELTSVTRRYGGIVAVDQVSFGIDQGMKVALIGPNGAGKSTLFGIVSGEVRPSSGQVRLEGRDVGRVPSYRRARRGFVRSFQVARVFSSLTVRENLQLASMAGHRKLSDLLRPPSRLYLGEAESLLAEIHLSREAERLAGSLSHGERKRLELGLILAMRPSLLLLDEPTAGMGVAERTELISLVVQSVEKRGLTLLFTEHDMDVVFSHSDRIVVMDRGRVVADGSGEAVRSDPMVQEIYLGRSGTEGTT
jgi:branched-chain amino acid transport system ATP-binding protein